MADFTENLTGEVGSQICVSSKFDIGMEFLVFFRINVRGKIVKFVNISGFVKEEEFGYYQVYIKCFIIEIATNEKIFMKNSNYLYRS